MGHQIRSWHLEGKGGLRARDRLTELQVEAQVEPRVGSGKMLRKKSSTLCHPRGHNDQIVSKPASTLGSLRKTSEGRKRERKERKEANHGSLPHSRLQAWSGIWADREGKSSIAVVGGGRYWTGYFNHWNETVFLPEGGPENISKNLRWPRKDKSLCLEAHGSGLKGQLKEESCHLFICSGVHHDQQNSLTQNWYNTGYTNVNLALLFRA